MSRENVETVRTLYELVNGGVEPPAEMFLPNAEFDGRDAAPDMGRGDREEITPWLRAYMETFEDYHVDLEEVIHSDDEYVVTAVRDGGRMKGSEAEVRNRFFHVIRFSGDKIAGFSTHIGRERALEAAGLSE